MEVHVRILVHIYNLIQVTYVREVKYMLGSIAMLQEQLYSFLNR